jgi:hypothetical protein
MVATGPVSRDVGFALELDDKARRWLEEHPRPEALVIAYTMTRCCGGTTVCDVRLRQERRSDRASPRLRQVGTVKGRELLMDSRIVERLPLRIPVTVRGFGPLKGLRLNLESEQWARLLYPEPTLSTPPRLSAK